jgi:hypothetical protein
VVRHGDSARDTELDLAGGERDFHASSPLEADDGGFDEAAGDAEVEDFAAKQQASMGKEDLGPALAGIAVVAATIRLTL